MESLLEYKYYETDYAELSENVIVFKKYLLLKSSSLLLKKKQFFGSIYSEQLLILEKKLLRKSGCAKKVFIFKRYLIRKSICYEAVVIRKKQLLQTTRCSEKKFFCNKAAASSGCCHCSENIAASSILWKQLQYLSKNAWFETTFLEIKLVLQELLLKQWMTVSSPVKINTVPFKEWMTAIVSVTKTDAQLQKRSCS